MREILFRGNREDNKEWVFGNHLFDDVSGKHYIIPFGNITESNKVGQEGCCYCVGFEVIPETVGQYAELSDRDCNKIFEGNIVEFYIDDLRIVGKVFYSKEATAFKVWYELPEQKLSIFSKTLCDCEYIKVIGNIHDNPELLKEAENK